MATEIFSASRIDSAPELLFRSLPCNDNTFWGNR
jgi:hypothetical protein